MRPQEELCQNQYKFLLFEDLLNSQKLLYVQFTIWQSYTFHSRSTSVKIKFLWKCFIQYFLFFSPVMYKEWIRQRRTHTALQKEMTQDIKSTHFFLKNNPNILITKADKGNTNVALDKTKYVNEIKTMLSDSRTCTHL